MVLVEPNLINSTCHIIFGEDGDRGNGYEKDVIHFTEQSKVNRVVMAYV